jgi:anti-sigma factor RsiW
MADGAKHPIDAIQDALDGRLDPKAKTELEKHLESCPSCRRELEALAWTKAQAASAKGVDGPFVLEDRMRRALDEEDRARAREAATSRSLRRFGPWLATAAAIAAAIWIFAWLRAESVPRSVAQEHRAYVSGALPLENRSVVPSELEAYFAARGLPFPMRVFDLGMMAYQLEGGRTYAVRGREGALIAYRGADGRVLLCRMYLGSVNDLPEPLERRSNQNIEFRVYRDSEVTLVFWQEGEVVCVLAGDADPETVIQLAFAKAVTV